MRADLPFHVKQQGRGPGREARRLSPGDSRPGGSFAADGSGRDEGASFPYLGASARDGVGKEAASRSPK